MLKTGFNKFVQELAEKAVKLMSDKYTDNEKAGIALSMALDTKDSLESCLSAIDKLTETNEKLMAQNKELLSRLETLQNTSDCINANVVADVKKKEKSKES